MFETEQLVSYVLSLTKRKKSQYINAILNCEFNDLFIRRHANLKNILE